MKDYHELSFAGRLHRLRELAVHALSYYALNNPEIVYHGWYTNLLYRVTTASGERFMLRLAAPGWRTFEDLRSEALWLEALGRDTTIPVPRIIPARSGEFVLSLSIPGIPKIWNTSLMSWVPGRQLRHYLTVRNLEKMGALFAELHHHGGVWLPPEGFTSRRFEHWLSRGEVNLITNGKQASAGASQLGNAGSIPSRWLDLLERMHQDVETAYAAMDRSDLRVIHCDLWHDNIKVHRGILHPLDFEDTVWGFRAHDIAMAMLDLLEATNEAQYSKLFAAFRHGYQAHLAWPAAPIEPFQIGRLLWMINWVACHEPQGLMSTIERHVPVFEYYEHTGWVTRPPAG